ncbi:MAG: hypothetical protein ABSD27_13345 [Bryobacteraceae bacterium]
MKTAARYLCLALVLFLFATNVYRALTQSITIDEASSFNGFYSGGIWQVLTHYDAGNHVLQSLLSMTSVSLFGLSEFSVRLPSLLGGLLYLVVAYRFGVWLFGPGWLAALSIALLGLNPFVLDYLSAARGYGLGLGFFFWAFYHLIRYVAEEQDPPAEPRGADRLYRAGIGLGLSVASVPIFLYPALAAAGTVAVLLIADARLSGRPEAAARQFWLVMDRLFGPALVVAFVILVIPLTRARTAAFYYGVSSLRDSVGGLVSLSYFHNQNISAWGKHIPTFGAWHSALTEVLIPGTLLIAVALCALFLTRWIRARTLAAVEKNEKALLLAGATLAVTVAMAVFTNRAFGMPYPVGRTGIYWPPLFVLAALGILEWLRRRGRGFRLLALPWLAFLVVSAGMFAAGFTTTHYNEWNFDSATKRIALLIRDRKPSSPSAEVRVGATWQLEPSLNFYRRRYGLKWIKPLLRDGADGDFDYYVLLPADYWLIKTRNLKVLFSDPLSQAVVALKP